MPSASAGRHPPDLGAITVDSPQPSAGAAAPAADGGGEPLRTALRR